MAATMNFRPAGFESNDDESSDDDGFMFGDGSFGRENIVRKAVPDKRVVSSPSAPPSYRGGFGKPPARNSNANQPRSNPWSFNRAGNTGSKPPTQNIVRAKMRADKHGSSEGQSSCGKVIPLEDFRSVILRGNIEAMKNYIDDGVPVDKPLTSGWTALMYAGNVANQEAVKILLEKGADPNFHLNRFTVLMSTTSSRKTEREEELVRCIELLVENGANIDDFDRYHMSALMYAAREGKARVVQRMVELKAHLDKQDSRGNTALTLAAMKGHLRVVQLLVAGGADINKRCTDGSTAADVAYNEGHEQVCNFLRKCGSSLAVETPLVRSVTADDASLSMLTSSPVESRTVTSVNADSESTCMKYGELELFLSGLDLGNLIPLFQEQQVTFAAFLRFTDHDLLKLGVKQIGVRKKLLDAIKDTHNKEWETASLPSVQYNKRISCAEAISMIANINKHASYIGSTVGFVSDQIREHPDILRMTQTGASVDDLCSASETALANVKILYGELSHLRIHLGRMSEKENFTPPDLIMPRKRKRRLLWRRMLLVGSIFSAMGLIVWKADYIASGCGALVSKAVKIVHK